MLNESKYQSHVRVRVRVPVWVVRLVSGFASGSCPVRVWVSVRVRVWFAAGFVSGFVSASCLVRGWVRV